ncbi:substrate-binding periplasmic protein [Agitococcus lubricus]|uniref:ABC-type amino acid transport substrate-binding protein n=1 Tax=Agitococcus lubricus TaxID=1077255 RepID=A0A2T5IWW7_9GAMM|nr:transporter substrate-binding domain-containing protein [Agitococcus lubricus]PTQ88405.1 ABC-type amino acid transport substrate-binding protein [Agitococcus lubricus]
MRFARYLLAVTSIVSSQLLWAAPLQLCVDKIPTPPFVYSEKINGAGKLRGYSLDLAKQLLSQAGVAYEVKSFAKTELEKRLYSPSASAGCDIVLDVRKGSEQEKYVHLSSPWYQLNIDAVYSWERYMTGLGVKTVNDFSQYQVCGLEGYDYGNLNKHIKIKYLPRMKDIVFDLKQKTCDVFLAEAAVMKYGQRANLFQMPPVGCVRLDGTVRTYHLGVAKHVVGGDAILVKLQQQFSKLTGTDSVMTKLAEEYDIGAMSCQTRLHVGS